MEIPFSKLSGAGNDFIIIDNRSRAVDLTHLQIRDLCTRRTGIGADGLILIDPSEHCDFSMKYYNADGYPGSMCGNGGRCAVYFASMAGIPSSFENGYKFEANGNRYDAWVTGPETVKLRMLAPEGFRNDMTIEGYTCHSVDTGSPHAIIYTDNLENIHVTGIGSTIRHRTDFFPEGTNVNFIEITSFDSLSLRTFERGVEDETLACGTGAVASALMSKRLGKIKGTVVLVRVKSGEILEVSFSEDMKEVFLTGPAKIVFKGRFVTEE
ncbi:MAG: diaminopimelate epimerase [Chlorobiaceae bacterium]|jgi:diaminopimelate epimerase|nr:diaminopimelate epimerase [Chlorobiaceae bacterium]